MELLAAALPPTGLEYIPWLDGLTRLTSRKPDECTRTNRAAHEQARCEALVLRIPAGLQHACVPWPSDSRAMKEVIPAESAALCGSKQRRKPRPATGCDRELPARSYASCWRTPSFEDIAHRGKASRNIIKAPLARVMRAWPELKQEQVAQLLARAT